MSGVSGTLLLCLAGNIQNDQIHKERLKTRFITALNCSYILLFLIYVSPRASYDTVAKPAIKRAALRFQCEDAATATELRAGDVRERWRRGEHMEQAQKTLQSVKKDSLFKTL